MSDWGCARDGWESCSFVCVLTPVRDGIRCQPAWCAAIEAPDVVAFYVGMPCKPGLLFVGTNTSYEFFLPIQHSLGFHSACAAIPSDFCEGATV